MTSLRLRMAGSALGLVLVLGSGCSRVHLGSHDAGGDHDGGPGPRVQCGMTLCAEGEVCCSESCSLCGTPDLACPAVLCTDDCVSDADCAPGEYCNFPDGSCGGSGAGVCTPRPEACPPVIRDTCGCDGVTYQSPCDAAASAVSVRHDGACDPPPMCEPQDAIGEGPCDRWFGIRWNGSGCESVTGCDCIGADCEALYMDRESCEAANAHCVPGGSCVSDADCDPGRYCHYPIGECAGTGTGLGECRTVPGELPCPPGAPPVCGCDGATYACELAANQVGVSALHEGACSDACAPMDAAGEGTCLVFFGYAWNGESCERIGGCSCVGADCERLFESDAECRRAYGSCDRMPGGECGGFVGYVCRPDEWCDFPDPHVCGGGDESGTCRPRPSACPDVLAPACGCDGTLFDNECEANRSGWDTWSDASMGCGASPPSP